MAGGLSVLLLGDGKGQFDAVWPKESGLVVPGGAKGLATLDLNLDGWVDFAVSVNDAPSLLFQNQLGGAVSDHRSLGVLLRSGGPNGKAIGARVTAVTSSGVEETAEIYAGGSYLSQSSSQLFFGHLTSDPIVTVRVRWPDGKVSEHGVTDGVDRTQVKIAQP